MWEPAETAKWDRATLIAAILINAHKKKGARTVNPSQLNPVRKQKGGSSGSKRSVKIDKWNWSDLKLMCRGETTLDAVRGNKPTVENSDEGAGDEAGPPLGDSDRDALPGS